jgi:hypothetical protein
LFFRRIILRIFFAFFDKVVGQYSSLDVQMFDASVDGNHLGYAPIDLEQAFSGEPLDLWLDLKPRAESHHKYPVKGSLHLQIQYSEYKPSAAAPAAGAATTPIISSGASSGAEEQKADDANVKALQEAALAAEAQAKADAERKRQQELEEAAARAVDEAARAAEVDRERCGALLVRIDLIC